MIGSLKELYCWGFSVWVVIKLKTNELWVVNDFRLLNSKIIFNESIIVNLKELIKYLTSITIFNLLNLLKVYNSITTTSRV